MRFSSLTRGAAVLAVVGLALTTGQAAGAAPTATAEPAATVAISPISLDGPAIADVTVTVTNGSAARMRDLVVAFRGPVGWQVAPSRVEVGAVRAGQPARATFQLRVPEERTGFFLRTFSATATYKGGDGAGTASTTRTERTGDPLGSLAEAYSNVGVTSEADTAPGDYDGDGNSFSAEKLADVGVVPGGAVEALGATLTWPDVAPGTPDNVPSAGQAVELDGTGERVVLLGSGLGNGATGTLTVYYTDGTSTSGQVGFPNWSFQDAGAHGATLVASSTGRNRPSGYGDAAYQYRVFAHSVAVDPARTVDFVVLPANANLRVFALGLG
jgi:hypothetical protein